MHRSIQLTRITSFRTASQVTRRKKLHFLITALQPAGPILAGRIALPLLLLGAGLVLVQPCAGQSGTWTETGSLATGRELPTATLLPNGKVLVACGYIGTDLASAELYDPATGTWTATGSLATGRFDHTATLLPNGKVLVAAGYNSTGEWLASAELYDPATGSWIATGSLATARAGHTATLLPNGKVLVAGGRDSFVTALASAELYDPASGTWARTGRLATGRFYYTATLLSDGKVLAAGGNSGTATDKSAELYDPANGTWTATGSLNAARSVHTATLLPDGKVLVSGGSGSGGTLSSAELYNPASGKWTNTGRLANRRYVHTATLLPDGKVLAAGGLVSVTQDVLSSTELYDQASGTWTATGSLANARYGHTATLLPDGKVLAASGHGDSGFLVSAELYVSDEGGELTLDSAASIQRGFAIGLPLSGPSGVEDRSGGPNKKYTVVMTFDQNIASVRSASSTCGSVQSIVIDSADAHKVNINLVNVAHGCNGSTITVTADSITDDQGNVLDSASVGLGLLLGDVNADRVVNPSDYNEAQMHKGQKADQENFRNDVNANGHIEQADIVLIQQQQGTSLP